MAIGDHARCRGDRRVRPIPLQNRVMPTGEIVSDPARGTLTGNRGIIHVADGRLGSARWSHQAWICCALDWQGRKRAVMSGRKWTELFFLDEAVALAAGHRPCGYCRRASYAAYRDAWASATGTKPDHKAMDRALHAARVRRDRSQIRTMADCANLPDGAFILHQGHAHLMRGDNAHPYAPTGYGPPIPRPSGPITLLTPAPSVAVLKAGYRPVLHNSAP